ncbi:MAG: DUF86 domain-containing protein [Oscillospiraceae bacterium]|jgi:uncharacterized protein with HEPN domain|nr:DUF86 domain-containing protein [Oscillospiraceae bacterium]
MDDRNARIVAKIIGHTERILDYCEGIDEASFMADSKLVDACVFNLIQIGELAGIVDDVFSEKHDNIAWRKMRGLRNRIVHDYEGIDLRLIWDIVTGDKGGLSELLKQLTELRDEL